MYKQAGLILVGAVCFDLGMVLIPAPSAAAMDMFIKIGGMKGENDYQKFTGTDATAFAKTCAASKGKAVQFQGAKYCQTAKAKATTGPATSLPATSLPATAIPAGTTPAGPLPTTQAR